MKKRFKKQGFEQNLLFYSRVNKIHMDLVWNLTIIIFNQLLMQICIFVENLKLIAFFFPKMNKFVIFMKFWKFGRRSMVESFPDFLLQV